MILALFLINTVKAIAPMTEQAKAALKIGMKRFFLGAGLIGAVFLMKEGSVINLSKLL